MKSGRNRAGAPGRVNFLLLGASALAVACGYGATAQAASTLKTLFSFANLRGVYPAGPLIADGAGNLYGATAAGGAHSDAGAVFELSPPAAGARHWTEKVIHSFDMTSGGGPNGGLIADSAGNLFGTTIEGGEPYLQGVVFELSPPKAGGKRWAYTVLHIFDISDGEEPVAGLIADKAGNLYGTTPWGGANTWGTVFELSPPAPGKTAWAETVLHSFNVTDGEGPSARLIMDAAGHVYGTTLRGGASGDGVVFELNPPAQGKTAWTERVLHDFDGANGMNPASGLIADGAGNLYGATTLGGVHNDGVAFKLSPPAQGKTAWTVTAFHRFGGTNGMNPLGALIVDGAGNFYGAAAYGGTNGDGVVFEFTP